MPNKDRARLAAAFLVLLDARENKRKVTRSCWVKESEARRDNYRMYKYLLSGMYFEDAWQFSNYIAMSAADLEELLCLVGGRIQKQNTHLRAAIPPGDRLVLTLHFLASGDSYRTLKQLFGIPVSTISDAIPVVCAALYDTLKDYCIKVPSSKKDWLWLSENFEDKWNVSHCVGVLDGRRVITQATKVGDNYYKTWENLSFLALIDAFYNFTYVDVVCTDIDPLSNSSLGLFLDTNILNLMDHSESPEDKIPTPTFIVAGSNGFPSKPYLDKESGDERVRGIGENVFGLIAHRFQILRKPMPFEPKKAEKIIMAVCGLHNFLMQRDDSSKRYAPPGTFDTDYGALGAWREDEGTCENLKPLHPIQEQSLSQSANSGQQTDDAQFEVVWCSDMAQEVAEADDHQKLTAACSTAKGEMRERFDEATLDRHVKYLSLTECQHYIELVKSGDRKALDKFDVASVDKTDRLVKRNTNLLYATNEELFDILHTTHLATCHGQQHEMVKEVTEKYCNIGNEPIAVYLQLCAQCRRRAEVGLIDMQSQCYEGYQWIMTYQDSATQFLVLRPLKTSDISEVSYQLIDIITTLGPPMILCCSERELLESVLKEIQTKWDGFRIASGDAKNCELLKEDVKGRLCSWLENSKRKDWPLGLKFIQFHKNCTAYPGTNQSPYEAMFGCPPPSVGADTDCR